MSKFKIGDRVIATEDSLDKKIKGLHGTIIAFGSAWQCLVQFDEHMDGHNGNHRGKDGHCFYMNDAQLKLEPIATPITAPNWVMVIRPDKSNPDKTIATLKLGKETVRTESVTRHYKDTYDRDAAIKAVVEKMCKGAEKPKASPVKEINRHAEDGEWIKIVQAIMAEGYVNGDILSVAHQSPLGKATVWSKNKNGKEVCIGNDEYVVLENYTPTGAVGETVCEEPVKELPKPIMINGKELKVGSKFILKRYEDVTSHICIGETPWRDMCKSVLTVKSLNTTQIDVWWHDLPWIIDISAIDRIIED